MADSKQELLRALKVPSLKHLELIRVVKRELVRRRREIETMKNGEGKQKALRAYAELLTSLEMGTLATS